MDVVIQTEPENGLMTVVLRGAATHQEHVAARDSVMQTMAEGSFRRLLVDFREAEASDASLADLFEFGESWRQRIPSPRMRIAYVMAAENQTNEQAGFVAQVASNRGTLIHTFDNPAEARAWLLS